MRKTCFVALLLFVSGCLSSVIDGSVGCTLENCRRMVSACRVEPMGGPSAACSQVTAAPAGFDWSPYCVQSCRQQGMGALVQCLADAAPRCEDAGFEGRDAIIIECAGAGTGSGSSIPFDSACEKQCASKQKECDVACVGGPQCTDCMRRGTSCAGCADAGFVACTDCSAACGHDYVECAQRCGS